MDGYILLEDTYTQKLQAKLLLVKIFSLTLVIDILCTSFLILTSEHLSKTPLGKSIQSSGLVFRDLYP